MSEHSHGHTEHDVWKKTLDHAFKELKEADDHRDARLHRNQELLERLIRDIFHPVFAQFIDDASQHGFHAEAISPQGGNRQVLSLKGNTDLNIAFTYEATAEFIRVIAQRPGAGQVNLLQTKTPEQFDKVDLADYLASQLQAVKPNKQ